MWHLFFNFKLINNFYRIEKKTRIEITRGSKCKITSPVCFHRLTLKLETWTNTVTCHVDKLTISIIFTIKVWRMTLASETMSSILQSPQSSNAVSSKSKLGFSIDSIVGAKNNSVFRSDSHSPPSPRDIEHASQKLRESLTSIVSPTDLVQAKKILNTLIIFVFVNFH